MPAQQPKQMLLKLTPAASGQLRAGKVALVPPGQPNGVILQVDLLDKVTRQNCDNQVEKGGSGLPIQAKSPKKDKKLGLATLHSNKQSHSKLKPSASAPLMREQPDEPSARKNLFTQPLSASEEKKVECVKVLDNNICATSKNPLLLQPAPGNEPVQLLTQNLSRAVLRPCGLVAPQAPCGTTQWVNKFTVKAQKLQRLPIPVHIEEFYEYGGKAVCSNHVFNFKIVEQESDLLTDEKTFFNPKFTYQIYNSDETLRGHEDPSIEVFLSPLTLRPYLHWNSRCRIFDGDAMMIDSKSSCHGLHQHKEDDIQGRLQQHFGPEMLITDRSEFIKHLNKEKRLIKPIGKFVSEFKREVRVSKPVSLFSSLLGPKRPKRGVQLDKEKQLHVQTKSFKVYKVNALASTFKHMNRHLQALLQFYIEGASFIPVDQYWNYFLVYLDNKLVAYATTFEEYLKVPKAAVTISQVLVLPPYQQHGIGSTLLNIMYQHYLKESKCTLIYVEDPATDFQRMKDSLDTKLILQHGFFRSMRNLGLHEDQVYLNCDTFKMCTLQHQEISEIRTKLKLRKDNIQRCFELLLLSCLDPNDHKVHEAYRKSILKRFADSRELLRPYFRFENFADRSMFTINDQTQQDALLRGHCCRGDGQLHCLLAHERPTNSDQRSFNGRRGQSLSVQQGEGGQASPLSGAAVPSHQDVVQKTATVLWAERHGLYNKNSQSMRTNRFTPTPWHEVHGTQVRYELPKTLSNKIKTSVKSFCQPKLSLNTNGSSVVPSLAKGAAAPLSAALN